MEQVPFRGVRFKNINQLIRSSYELIRSSGELIRSSDELIISSDELIRSSDELIKFAEITEICVVLFAHMPRNRMLPVVRNFAKSRVVARSV